MAGSDSARPNSLVARPVNPPFAFRNGSFVSVAQFMDDVAACSETLPACRYVVDPSEDRYGFMVRFLAAVHRSQVNLLPSQRDRAALLVLCQAYDDAAVLDEATSLRAPSSVVRRRPFLDGDPDGLAAIAFTSGTTAQAQAHPKTWAMLAAFRQVHWRYLSKWLRECGAGSDAIGLVATVPPWHMYGLEWTVLLPTIAPVTLHCGGAFYPKDVAAALDSFDNATLLVTTPMHLRAMLKSPPPAKPVTLTVCATAPLDATLARRVERHLDTRIIDLYGCSEIGSLATRHPIDVPAWSFFDCFDLDFDDGRLRVRTPFLPHPVTLADSFVRLGPHEFRMEGRATDIVKIGGKRESLANLNNLLLAIPGVDDGVVYQPEALGLPSVGRLAAVVVASGLDVSTIRLALAKRVDSAFVPRPIRLVDALPRQESSKLSAEALRRLVAR